MSRKGEIFTTNEGYLIEILEYFNAHRCTIKFIDGTILHDKEYKDIKKGQIKHPNHRCLCGIGFLGIGDHRPVVDGKKTDCYDVWSNMINRCYNENLRKRYEAYTDCSVSDDWQNFQNFSEWYNKNFSDGMVLDKDILIKNNKIYSQKTCSFIPPKINLFFVKGKSRRGSLPIGVSKHRHKFKATSKKDGISIHLGYFDTPHEAFDAYKEWKESEIKKMANEFRHIITPETYTAMLKYKVEVTD